MEERQTNTSGPTNEGTTGKIDTKPPDKLSPISLDPRDYPIEPHRTWDIWDSTKITEAMRCMRRVFYNYVLGFRTQYAQHDLVFGQAWHLAMDYLYANGLSLDNIGPAMEVFNNLYREDFDEFTDLDFEPKVPLHAEKALESYILYHANDGWKVLSITQDGVKKPLIEVSGSVQVSNDWRLAYRIDKVMGNKERHVIVRDHKTSKQDSKVTRETWGSKMQPNLYGHTLLCLIDENHFRGVELDLTFFRKKDLDDGGVNRHQTIPVYRDQKLMNGWLYDTLTWLDQIKWNFEAMSETRIEDPVMKAWPRNENGCTAFFKKCPYYDICHTLDGNNPLKYTVDTPIGFIVNFWDPTDVGSDETVKTTMHLESKSLVK